MPQDLSKSKKGTGAVHPDGAIDAASGLTRVEPFLTPTMLKQRFLWGLPLVSPITQQPLTDEMLKDIINRAANQVEADAKVHVFPIVLRHRLPFDINAYVQFMYLELPNKPLQRLIKLAICSATYAKNEANNPAVKYPAGSEIFVIPNDWVEMGNARKGRLNVIPLHANYSADQTANQVIGPLIAVNSAASYFMIGHFHWVPAFWLVEGIYGFCSEDGEIPVLLNELIGLKAAMMVLDNLIPLFRATSQSLSIDGLGQSTTDQLPMLLKQKREDLKEQYLMGIQILKSMTENQVFSTHL